MPNKHANKEGGKGVHTQQSNQGGKDTSKDQVAGQKKSNSQPHDDTQSDSLDYQQGEKSKIIKPSRQKGEDNQKRAGGNPQPTQPTATDTHSIGSSPKPTAAKHEETLTDTQTTVTSPQPAAAKSQQTAADTQTIVVSPQPTAAKSQQTAADTQTTVVSPQLTAAKSQPTTGDTQPIRTSPLPTAAKSQHTVADTQPIGSSPQPTAADTQTTGVNPKPIGGNLQQIGDNPQHKDLSETKSKDIGEEGQITMKHNNSSPKENTTHRREASSHHGQENRDEGADGEVDQQVEEPVYIDSRSTKGQTNNNKQAFSKANPTLLRNRQPGIPENTKAGQQLRNDKKERTYGIPKQTGSRSEFSDDEQYDMTEANRIEKSRSRTDMNDWTNQLWTHLINAIVTVIVCAIFMIVYSQWGQVQRVSSKDNSHESKQPMPMEKVIMDLRNENEKYKTMLDDISSKLMTLDKANRRVDNLNEKFGELEKSVKTMTESNTGMLAELRTKIDKNGDKLSKNGERIEQVNTDISNTRTDLEEKLRQEENNVKKIIQESQKVSKMLHEMNKKIKKTEEEISNSSETLKKVEEAKTVLQNELKNVDEKVAVLKANAFNKSVMLNLVVFLTIAVFALIIGMLIIWNRVSFDHHGNTPRHGSGTNPRMSVIEQVPNKPPLTNNICVISYGQTNESFNHRLVHKLMRQLSQPLPDTPVRGHLINTHADIANIPHCKLIFMCVEFSTRHVIIEEPGIGQGDIRRTTYDAVKKLGATLVILYTRDHESQQLGDKLRYQKDIYCVATQPELKVLDDQKCFYSVFNSFTQSQVESLETVISKALQ